MHGILPPHLTEHLAKNGHAAFIKALRHDAGVRHARAVLASDSTPGEIEVFDAKGSFSTEGLDKAEDDNPEAKRVRDWADATFALLKYKDIPDAIVHYGENYSNAFYDGKWLAFGTGDGVVFKDFTLGLDVFAHEFGHKLIELGPNLEYASQPGALNESMADVIGASVRAHHTKVTEASKTDWRIGAELFIDNTSALRDMKNPGTAYNNEMLGTDPQVGHMDNYDNTFMDNGGVHINSGIPNKAFVLAAEAIGGPVYDKPLRIWLKAMIAAEMRTNFEQFAKLCVDNAGDYADAVRGAWDGVGVKVAASS